MDIRFELQALPNRNSEVIQNSHNGKEETNKQRQQQIFIE